MENECNQCKFGYELPVQDVTKQYSDTYTLTCVIGIHNLRGLICHSFCKIIEVATSEFDEVVRLKDDYGRVGLP